MYVREQSGDVRPDVVVWFEPESHEVVGTQVLFPDDSDDLVADGLRAAMARPTMGPPREPRRIRVADPAFAARLREQVGGDIEIFVGATPELDAVLDDLRRHLAGVSERPGYLGGTGVAPEVVASFFGAAAGLFRQAPWQWPVDDAQVLAVDIPALGVREGYLSVMGHLGQSRGYLFFESHEDFEAFGGLAAGKSLGRGADLARTRFLSQTFERGSELSSAMRREIMMHRWEVCAADAFPYLVPVDVQAIVRPLVPRDLAVATLCSEGLARFAAEHRDLFRDDQRCLQTESYRISVGRRRLLVRVTGPHPRVSWGGGGAERGSREG